MATSRIATLVKRPGVQTILLASATGLSQVLTALISILVAREVSTSDLGTATVGLSVAVVLTGLVDFGCNQLWLRDYAHDISLRSEMAVRLLSKIKLSVLLAVLFEVVSIFVTSARIWWPANLYVLFLQTEQTLQTPLRARAKVPLVSASMFVNRLAALAMVLVLGTVGMGAMRLVAALAFGSLVASAMLWIGGARQELAGATRGYKSPWKGSRHYGIYSLSTSLQSLDAPLLGAFANAAAVGLYGAINRWTAPINLLTGAFSSASVPHVATAGNLHRGWQAIRKSAVLLIGALAIVLATALLADPVVGLLLGPQYHGAAPALQVLALAMGVVIFNQPVAMLLQSTGHDKAVSIALPISLVLQLGAISIFAPRWGAVGASLAMLTAQVVMALMLGTTFLRAWIAEGRVIPRRALMDLETDPAPTAKASGRKGSTWSGHR